MSSQPKGARGQRERDCLWYKLLGKCDDEECTYSHENKVPSYSETVDIPEKIPLEVAQKMKGEYQRNLSNIAKHLIIPDGQAAVKIVTSDKEKLPKLVETYIVNLSLLLNKYPMGPGRCCIHHEGVSNCLQGTLLHFQEYKGRLPPKQSSKKWTLYELCTDEETSSQRATVDREALIAKSSKLKAQDTMEDVYKEIEEVYGSSVAGPTRDKEVHRVRMTVKHQDGDGGEHQDHRDYMKEMLKGGLKWLCDKRQESGYVTKLEARFGKVLWGNLPEDMTSGRGSWGIETFVDLLLHDTKHKRIFDSVVREESAGGIREMLGDDSCSSLETYDIKLVVMPSDGSRCGDRLDVRVKFEQGQKRQPEVLLAKKNEVKTIVLDLICLHRDQDIRMTLNHYEVVKPTHPLVNKFIQTLALPNPDDHAISFVAKTKDWNVYFVRHKTKQTYVLGDKYMITVSHVQECALDWPRATDDKPFRVTPELYNTPHTEIEFHNKAWECAFGRDAGFSPEQSLALHMEQPTVEPSVGVAIPHPWQPEHILKDYEEVWEQLETLNETLDSP